MEFKVGDFVRPTRDLIINRAECGDFFSLEYLDGFEIIKTDKNVVYYGEGPWDFYYKDNIELVPGKDIFTRGELVEVKNDKNQERQKGIYLATVPGHIDGAYMTVYSCNEKEFLMGKEFDISYWKEIRKPITLTRKEICEKFGIDYFTLTDG